MFKLAAFTDLTVSILSIAGGVKVQSIVSGPVFSAPLKGKVCAFVFKVLQCGCHFAAFFSSLLSCEYNVLVSKVIWNLLIVIYKFKVRQLV